MSVPNNSGISYVSYENSSLSEYIFGDVQSLESLSELYITLTYDEVGRAVNRTYFTDGDGLQTNFDYYDWSEQVSSVPQGGLLESSQTGTFADNDSLASLAYIYDAVGNVASITDLVQSPAQVQAFGYDSLHRLASATGSAGFGGAYSEAYTYDTQGRMDSKAGDALNYSATRTGTCQTNTLTPAASSTIIHAVSSKSGGNTYTYDCNGNAIARGGQTLIYDEENRLVEVQENSVTIAEYEYDGDGNRVKAAVTGGELTITTLFIGSYYEQIVTDDGISSTTEWKKYYYAGSVRLAMREDTDNPLYLIGDHLGSTSLVLDTSGLEVAKRSYLPFGEAWGVSATDLPTTFTYTGQREAAEIGLMYYVARWYDSEIGHFIQADTIVPGAGNPLAWNRFGYVMYNPIRYTDPSGHWFSGDHYDPACAETDEEHEDYVRMIYSTGHYSDSGTSSTPQPRKNITPKPSPTLDKPSTTPTPSPYGYDTSPYHNPTSLPAGDQQYYPDLGFAFSISGEQSMGLFTHGTTAETGIVWINGPHPFISIGETSPSTGGAAIGINLGLAWGIDSTTDFEGWGQQVGFTIPFLIVINGVPVPVSASVGLSFEPEGGFLGVGRPTGITLSPQLGPEIGFFWDYTFTTILGN